VSECDSLPALRPTRRAWPQRHNVEVRSFAIEIFRYLWEHPEAQKTLENIMVWWVPLLAWPPVVSTSVSARTGPRRHEAVHENEGAKPL
jgi:hypothetical protein